MDLPVGFSVIIPAHNEEAYLACCINAIRKSHRLSMLPIETIVVLNRCTDRTEDIALELGARIVRNDEKNLSQIRNAGVNAASYSYIVTVDADSLVSENMFPNIERALSRKDVVGGGVNILPERISLGIFFTGLCILPIALWYRISGGLFWFRKKDFDAIGGFDESLVSVEDIDFAKRLKAHGKKTGKRFKTLWSSWIITSCRKFDRLGDWFFFRNPGLTLALLSGKDQEASNKVWYDFQR